MPRKPSKTIAEQIFEAKLKIIEAQENYQTQLYLDTMPEIGPTYKYCYATSNWNITVENQSVDAWLRAVIKHMGLRHAGHGGQKTNALVMSVYKDLEKYEKYWIAYQTNKLKKLNTTRIKKVK